jgi:hypothetical protein
LKGGKGFMDYKAEVEEQIRFLKELQNNIKDAHPDTAIAAAKEIANLSYMLKNQMSD